MEELIKDVKPEVSQTPSKSEEEKEQSSNVSEDVKPQEDVVDKTVYDKVREAMKAERQQRREKETKLAELEAKIEQLGQKSEAEPQKYGLNNAKADILFEMNRDPFVKENLDLVYDTMQDKGITVKDAIRELKADYFDRIQREGSQAQPNKPLKQEKPTATPEPTKPKLGGDPTSILNQALRGEIEVDPGQLQAIRRTLGK